MRPLVVVVVQEVRECRAAFMLGDVVAVTAPERDDRKPRPSATTFRSALTEREVLTGARMNDRAPERDLSRLAVPRWGRLAETGDRYEPYRLVGADGATVAPVAMFFQELLAAG